MLGVLIDILLVYFAFMALFVGVSELVGYCLARTRFADPAYKTHFSEDYPSGALKALVRDFISMSRYYLLYPAGYFQSDPPENDSCLDELPPVLFVHGWTENRSTWAPHIRRFKADKRRKLHALSLWPPDAPLEVYRPQLETKIGEVLSKTRHEKLLLVGHSMGGLLSRDYVANHGPHQIERIITIATPHKGSVLSWATIGRSPRQMTPHAPFIQRLEADPAIKKVDVHCIATVHDNLVVPFDYALLDGATHHLFTGWGHTSITTAPEVMELLEQLIYRDPAAKPAAPTPAPASEKSKQPQPAESGATADPKPAPESQDVAPTPEKKDASAQAEADAEKSVDDAQPAKPAPEAADDPKAAIKAKLKARLEG